MGGMSAADPSVSTVSPEEVARRVAAREDLYVVDLREPREYQAGHIPESILIPAGDFADRFTRELDAQDTVILVCDRGMTSEAAARHRGDIGKSLGAQEAGGMRAYAGPLQTRD